ncbi:hypothetical protein EVG20_g7694 [Dentipellis fragilis]|uniref:Uncharacterized protein n=1 Tax=Dentipellis fragilis TaxID=205917 RepID=A0A4Y9YBY6_9AGAM|nr:hypothetical protein EVG20_g7694 [Dentipellis fragilis]
MEKQHNHTTDPQDYHRHVPPTLRGIVLWRLGTVTCAAGLNKDVFTPPKTILLAVRLPTRPNIQPEMAAGMILALKGPPAEWDFPLVS